ncbi:hypothetical protein CRUP_037816 [Coryphaenoides rupestris]|nr:hypothetical protein CRUP_037816 [Coryphaenoides rupestris]
MAPFLARSAPSDLNHWWSQLRFRLQNKKGWNEITTAPAASRSCWGALGETALHIAVMNDNADAAVALMDGAPELINEPMTSELMQGVTPLHIAVVNQNSNLVRELIQRGGDAAAPRVTGTYFKKRVGGLVYYGALGETALHIAVMNDNADAAVALMDGAPELINEPMTSELMQGVTPLHIAVVNQNSNLVRELIQRGGDAAAPRVTGTYFKKRVGGLVYYDIMSMLMDAGASTRPNKTIACQAMDLIMARDVELDHALPLDMVPNYRELTPFKMAAKEGNIVAFQHLVNKRRVLQWSLGPLTSNLYDLSEIDSWADNMSVLELIARRILEVTPVRQLVSLKWNLYGKHYFRLLLVLYLLYIVTFTLCCVFRPLKDAPENYTTSDMDKTIRVQKTLSESYVTYEDSLRLAGEVISVLGAILILLLEIPDILRVGAKRYFGQTALGGPFHIILISYACLVVLLCVVRASELSGEDVLMALCLVLGWSNVMFFARGFQMLGPYVIMIQKIIFGDLTKFMWLTLWMVYMTQDPESIPPYRSFPITLFSQFELSVGLIDLPVDHTFDTPPIVHVLHCTFSVVSYILLLNLLIAMMSDTHWRVAQERDELWRTQVVATTLMLERRLPRCLWPRLGVCGLNYGLKEYWYLRNDLMAQKMRRYVNAFAREGEGGGAAEREREEAEKGGGGGGGAADPWNPELCSSKRRRGFNSRSHAAWQVIRRSALSMDLQPEEAQAEREVQVEEVEEEEVQDIRFV